MTDKRFFSQISRQKYKSQIEGDKQIYKYGHIDMDMNIFLQKVCLIDYVCILNTMLTKIKMEHAYRIYLDRQNTVF